MASTKGDGAAAAAKQLGLISLNESGEGKDNDAEPDAINGTKLLCSECGKKSDTLKKCTACKCVWYCDKKCQNKHWKEHKIECRPIKQILDQRGEKLNIGTELEVGPLGKVPQREECPICMRVLPIYESLQMYAVCCGKTICCACDFQHEMKSSELAAERGQKPVPPTCAFCRTAPPRSDEDTLAQLSKRVELNDPDALCALALTYGNGGLGLPVDQAKCIELLQKSADLGYLDAHYQLGGFHNNGGKMGLEQNKEKSLKYYEKAAEGGHLLSRHNLGCIEHMNGDFVASMRHLRLSASRGYRKSMDFLISCFELGLLHHGDLAKTLQSMYSARAEMRSEDRNKFLEYLKRIGEYEEGCDY